MTLTTQQLDMRKRSVGSTDSAAILAFYYPELAHLSKSKNASDVWLRICHGIDLPTSAAMSRGTRVEDSLRKMYQEKVGPAGESPGTMRHPSHLWMVGSPDSLTPKEVVEFKTVSRWVENRWGEPGTDKVPDNYNIQVQHLMAVAMRKVAVVLAAFGTDFKNEQGEDDFAIERTEVYLVKRDEELIERIVSCGRRFYESFVISGVSPPIAPMKNKRKHKAILQRKYHERSNDEVDGSTGESAVGNGASEEG